MPRHRCIIAAAFGLTLFAAPAQAQPNSVTVALDWTPNTNHIGLYVAQAMGFYEEEGLDVEILPYSDTAAGTLLANKVADFGILGSIGLFTLRTAGADLVATYAVVQTETGRLVFNAEREDIQSPRDLDGLVYAGFGSAWERALIETIIRTDGGAGDFEIVTLGTSAYEALANNRVDFTLEVYTWEGVANEIAGREQRAFRYADYGVPDQHTTLIGSNGDYIAENPETAAAFVRATRDGYLHAVENPQEAADILIAANSDVLTNHEQVHASMRALVEGNYLRTADGVIGTIDPEIMENVGNFLFEAGILVDGDGNAVGEKPDFSAYYTNALLEDPR